MLTRADAAQNETLELLKHLLGGRKILFTLVGSAGCREYGLSRTANDLDFVVDPYQTAMEILNASGEFEAVLDDPDPTQRTCTRLDTKTGVRVDFLKSGIRINDGSRLIGGARYRDPMPIHTATGAGDVAPLPTLIAMKLNAAISGEDTLKLGADAGGRSREEIQKDIADIRELIIIRGLGRSLQLGHDRIQSCYEKLVDEKA